MLANSTQYWLSLEQARKYINHERRDIEDNKGVDRGYLLFSRKDPTKVYVQENGKNVPLNFALKL